MGCCGIEVDAAANHQCGAFVIALHLTGDGSPLANVPYWCGGADLGDSAPGKNDEPAVV
jgi:hypothetical protein